MENTQNETPQEETYEALREAAPLPGTPHELMQYFEFANAPEPLRTLIQPFAALAKSVSLQLPNNSQRDVVLQELLAAKDAAVRCVLFRKPSAFTL